MGRNDTQRHLRVCELCYQTLCLRRPCLATKLRICHPTGTPLTGFSLPVPESSLLSSFKLRSELEAFVIAKISARCGRRSCEFASVLHRDSLPFLFQLRCGQKIASAYQATRLTYFHGAISLMERHSKLRLRAPAAYCMHASRDRCLVNLRYRSRGHGEVPGKFKLPWRRLADSGGGFVSNELLSTWPGMSPVYGS